MEHAGRSAEVVVVGGSAAGFFTAHLLAQRGWAVRVFEAAERLAPAPRTLIVTSRIRELLGSIGDAAVLNEIRRFELFTDGRTAVIPLQQPDLIVERATLICSLAERAREAGAQVLLGRKFIGLEPNGQGLRLRFERRQQTSPEEVLAGTLIAADGSGSRVAAAAGWPQQPTVPVVQAIVRLPKDLPSDTVRVWFIPEETPYFYWLLPESPTRGVLGLISHNGQQSRSSLDRFLRRQALSPIEFQAARIPQYTAWRSARRRIGCAEAYVVGDAAGHVKVSTVGGIVTGFRGALGIAEAITNGGSSRRLRALRRELDLHLLLRKLLQRFTQADYSRLIDLLNGPARSALGQHTRDELPKLLWQLCVSQPRLLLLGIRGLLAPAPSHLAGWTSE
jgi:flavin-dependent dehydrogenase